MQPTEPIITVQTQNIHGYYSSRYCCTMAIGVIFLIGSLFALLATYQELPNHSNVISEWSNHGGEALGYSTIVLGLLILIFGECKERQRIKELEEAELPSPTLTPKQALGDKYTEDNKRNTWYAYRRLGWIEEDDSDKYKVHVSIQHDEKNISKALPLIFRILHDYNISSFKAVPLENVENTEGDKNINGKEFVIYIQESELEHVPKMLQKMRTALKANRVAPGKPSNGDLPIGDDSYFYTRSTSTIFGEYMIADDLKGLGFTFQEAVFLSPAPLLNLIKLKAQSACRAAKVNSGSLERAETIFQQYKKRINDPIERISDMANGHHYETDWPPLLFLIIGAFDLQKKISATQLSIIKKFFTLPDTIVKSLAKANGEYMPNDLRELFYMATTTSEYFKSYQGLSLKNEIIDPYLRKAAFVTSCLNPNLQTVGSILPAIYFHWMKVLVDKPRENMTLTSQEELELIKQIALCSLRKDNGDYATESNVSIDIATVKNILSRLPE